MKILKGKRQGETVDLGQWANGWITGYPADGSPLILKPPMVQLDAAEIARMRETEGHRKHGFFWQGWRLDDDGLFAKREG